MQDINQMEAIAANMFAVARGRKKKGNNKRSKMLRTIMPMLSRENGDNLADAIDKGDSALFTKTWDNIKNELVEKLHHS